jgi:hypothetical protein
MYPADWHRIYGDQTGVSARTILPPLLRRFGAGSLLEVGCGNAHWTQAAIDAGVADYAVVDGPWNERADLLVDTARFVEHHLDQPLELDRRFDLALCLEVAEHVAPAAADTLVGSLVRASDVVAFGAAIPLQGGFGHVNEQWPSWWRAKFALAGYAAFDLVRPVHWSDRSIHYWYRQNMFVYVNGARDDLLAIAREAEQEACAGGPIFDAVHPEKFDDVAAYRSISGKRLAAQFPRWLIQRARSVLRL